MTAEASAPKPARTQAWLQKIYARPAEFLGLTVAILNDEEILLAAPTFKAAREGVAKLGLPTEGPNITYFHVPHSLPEVCILTLRVRSLKESLCCPFIPSNCAAHTVPPSNARCSRILAPTSV